MVVIVSEEFELSTSEVMEWVDALGGEIFRLNGGDFFKEGKFQQSLELNTQTGHNLSIKSGDKELRWEDIDFVWFRRDEGFAQPAFISAIKDKKLRAQVSKHIFQELLKSKEFTYKALAEKPHLGNPIRKHLNKFTALQEAINCGLDIPASIITDNKESLRSFSERYPQIISKAISDSDFFQTSDGKVMSAYTNEVSQDVLEEEQEGFCMSLAQELLEKDYEIRTFYLFGKCYSMAIFSQLDEQTNVDFRKYNIDQPNRSVPYLLPQDTENKVRHLMDKLGLSTGSLDFVKTKDGRLVFLEVNPVGQFGMVSKPCNYPLEKIIAEYLVSHSQTKAKPHV